MRDAAPFPCIKPPSSGNVQRADGQVYLQGGLHRSSASCQTRTSCLCGSSVPGLSSPPLRRTSCWEPMETQRMASLRSSLNKCFSHTLTSSLNIQVGPSTGIIFGSPCGQLWFASRLWSSGTGKTLYKKENACSGGSHGELHELSHQS